MTVSTSPARRLRRSGASTRRLRRVLIQTRVHYQEGGAPTLRHLLAPLGAEATTLACAMLALPFLSPVSLGPITTPVSVLIALLGWQLLRGTRSPLPDRLMRVSVPQGVHRAMSAVLRRVHRWLHRISRPRLPQLVTGSRGRILCASGVIAGALLLAVPVPMLPLTNTFPALAILLFALGWLEQDGVLTLLGVASALFSAAIFAALGAAVVLFGWEAVQAAVSALTPW